MTISSPLGVLLINLDRRGDRLQAMQSRIGCLGIDFHRISAVDGCSVSEVELSCSLREGPVGFLDNSTRACTASHVKAWQYIVDSGLRYALILEDDVILHPDIAILLANDAWIPASIDLLKVEKFAPNYPSKILAGKVLAKIPSGQGEISRMYSRHTGAAAYILSRKGAEIALSMSGSFNVPVDHLLFNETLSPLCGKLNPAIVVQPLCWQDHAVGSGSDIAASRASGKMLVKSRPLAKFAQSLKRAYYEVSLIHVQLFRLLIGQAYILTLRTPQSSGRTIPKLVQKILCYRRP